MFAVTSPPVSISSIRRIWVTFMRVRSHLDPTLFVIYQHVDSDGYEPEFEALARSLPMSRGTDIGPLLRALRERERRTLAHERYHFWQGLRLPFLHMYALMTLRGSFLAVRDLARADPDWRRWPKDALKVRDFDRLDCSFHLFHTISGKLALGVEKLDGFDNSIEFTAKGLLEYAASIFDYQISCKDFADMSDPQKFARWRKLRPGYLEIHDFLSQVLKSERLPLRVALPLVNAAFCTSSPERAFFELLGRLIGAFASGGGHYSEFIAQPEPCRWPEFFRLWLEELSYDIPFGETPNEFGILNLPYFYMDPKVWLGTTFGGGIQHPFLGPPAQEWIRLCERNPGLEDFISLPGYVTNQAVLDAAWAAEPQLRVLRVFLDDGIDRVFAIGDGDVGKAFKGEAFDANSSSEFRGAMLDIVAAYSAFRRTFSAHFSEGLQICYHKKCPYYESNFCNAYPLVPEAYENCGFPARMDSFIEMSRGEQNGPI
jgi:hypothetical protein